MAKLIITAAVTGSYRRGGLDLSGGKTVELEDKDVTAAQLKSLKSDARVTISEDKSAAKPKPSEPKPPEPKPSGPKSSKPKAAKVEAGDALRTTATVVKAS